MQIDIGARVRSRDGSDVGEVHRVVVDLDREAVVSIVVLRGRLLSRDILVPLEYLERVEPDGIVLSLTADELEQLPDFAYNEFVTPPPTWAFPIAYSSGAVYIPTTQRERLGGNQVDLTPGTKVWATDGELGSIDQVEIDARDGRVAAFWLKTGGLFPHDLRVPAEWIASFDEERVQVGASRAEVEELLSAESRARVRD